MCQPSTICQLCLEEKPLQLSHVISEFMYQEMYDEHHRLNELSHDPTQKEKQPQKGLRERLLCWDCEQQFGRYETYAANVLFENGCGKAYDGNLILLSGIEYRPFKLFLMSLLWRMGIAKEELAGIDLGEHAERLRLLLHNEDPADHLTYACLIVAVVHQGQHNSFAGALNSNLSSSPQTWQFVAAGLLFTFFAPEPHEEAKEVVLDQSGFLVVMRKEMLEIEILAEKAVKLAEAMRQREVLMQKRKEEQKARHAKSKNPPA